jgi:dsRNA-specific ribonuclease
MIKTKYLYRSLTTASCDDNPAKNYEVLELVGDSVIKFVASAFLYANINV